MSNNQPKIPITIQDLERSKKWLRQWPHVFGIATLLAVVAFTVVEVDIAKTTAFVLWCCTVIRTMMAVRSSSDMMLAWEKGEGKGKGFRRAGPDKEVDDD